MLAVLTVVLPVVLFAGVAWLSYDGYFAAAREELQRAAAVNREHAIKVFETHELIATQIGATLAGRSDESIRADEPEIHRQLRAMTDPFDQIQDIWLIDASGRALVAAGLFPVPKTVDYSDRSYFRAFRDGAMAPERSYVGEVLRGRALPTTFFQVTRMRRQAGTGAFNGVTAVSVDPGYFERFYREAAAGRFGAMGLTREDGTLLARYPAPSTPLEQIPRSETFARAVRGQPDRGIIEAVSPLEGVARLNAYQRLPNHPVYVTVTIDRSEIIERWRSDLAKHLIFGVPATLALLLLSLLALRFTRQGEATLASLRAEVARREAVEEQLRQSQKMEAVGRLTGGIAHDFNNLLTIIQGNLELIAHRLVAPDKRIARGIEHALLGTARAARLTQGLLAFSRQQPLQPASTDVNRLVAGMSDLLRSTLGETIAVETVLAGGLWRTSVDPNQLEAAILNLAVNARDAMPGGGKLTVETANAHLDEAYAAAQAELKPGQYVLIAVSDTGAGMSPDVVGKAFDPFFTTKPAGQGTGLGLSQVYGFMKQSGGHAAIYSEVGQGTIVKLYLPRLMQERPADDAAATDKPGPARPRGVGQTILVVEDDAMVCRFAVEALEEAGYRTLATDSGGAALTLLHAHPETAMLFTDVVLGQSISGRELADQALAIRPDLKVLFTTGYSRNAIVHHGRLDDGVNFLGKPYSVPALLAKVEALLAE